MRFRRHRVSGIRATRDRSGRAFRTGRPRRRRSFPEVDLQFGNRKSDMLPGLLPVHAHNSLDGVGRTGFQPHGVTLDKAFGNRHQHHVARDAAVVEPVADDGRHAFGQPFVVHGHHQRILPVAEQVRHIEIERRIAAFVVADMLPVQKDMGEVVRSPEIEVLPFSGLAGSRELMAQPNHPFVVEELIHLRIPVAGNGHHGRKVEVVLLPRSNVVHLLVLEETVGIGSPAVVVVTGFERIGEIVPIAVQRPDFAPVDMLDQRIEPFGALSVGKRGRQQGCQNQDFFHAVRAVY